MAAFNSPWPVHLAVAELIALLVLGVGVVRWLHQRTQQKRSETEQLWFANLHYLSRVLSETSDPQFMAEQVLERTLEMFPSSAAFLLLQTAGPDPVEHGSGKGLSGNTVGRFSTEPLRTFLSSCSDRWGKFIVFRDICGRDLETVSRRESAFVEFRRVLLDDGIRTVVLVGLRFKGKPCGALIVGSRVLRRFAPGELWVVVAVANQVSIALQNRLLRKAVEHHDEELKTLQRMGESLRTTFDLQAQAQILTRELAGLIGARNFSLALQESPGGLLEKPFVLSSGASGDSDGQPYWDGLSDYVLRTRAPLLITHDVAGITRRLGIQSFDPRLRAWAGVPIPFSDGSMGVLAVADLEREQTLDDRQFQLLQVLSSEAAGAIENARVLRREQQRVRHLALLNGLGREISSVSSPRELLPNLCQRIGDGFGYDFVRIETLDRAGGELVTEAERGYGPEAVARRFKVGEGLSGVAARMGEPVLANSVQEEKRYIALAPGAQSSLSLPLKYGSETLGVLTVECRRKNNFSQQDVLTLGTLADQLGNALHNAHVLQLAQAQAITDGLTGLKTHRYLMEALEAEWKRAPRSGRSFSVIMMDLDGFKEVNDRAGHLEGDRVLAAVARVLEMRSRQSTALARYGGDEFVMLVPDATAEQAGVLAERLRASIAADPYLTAQKVTASLGIATFPVHGATPEEILRIADSGMYLAKHEGGNRVRLASHSGESVPPDLEKQLVEAYLGVTVKRMFSTGPDTFNQYLQRFQKANQESIGGSPSLLETVTALAFAIDAKDHYTQGHSQSVSRLATQIARQLGLSEDQVEEIRLAGILHDIGKIGVPENVLNKPARLTEEEYRVMKGHATLGDKILEPLKVKAFERIRPMVRHHHEWVNGEGYPDGLKSDNIPLGARILTVADSFDTMVSERGYQRGKSTQEAVEELRRCCGSQFDPAVVDVFVKSLETLGDPRMRAAFEKVAN